MVDVRVPANVKTRLPARSFGSSFQALDSTVFDEQRALDVRTLQTLQQNHNWTVKHSVRNVPICQTFRISGGIPTSDSCFSPGGYALNQSGTIFYQVPICLHPLTQKLMVEIRGLCYGNVGYADANADVIFKVWEPGFPAQYSSTVINFTTHNTVSEGTGVILVPPPKSHRRLFNGYIPYIFAGVVGNTMDTNSTAVTGSVTDQTGWRLTVTATGTMVAGNFLYDTTDTTVEPRLIVHVASLGGGSYSVSLDRPPSENMLGHAIAEKIGSLFSLYSISVGEMSLAGSEFGTYAQAGDML